MASIKEKAILVSLSVSIWTNTARDEDVVSGLMKSTKTEEDVHRYKKVLIKPEMLSQVRAARIALRKHWWDYTLPWGNGGVRILPSDRYQTFIEQMRDLRADYERAVDAFCRNYPKMKAEARQRLRNLFNEEDFPSIDGIKRKFGMELEFAPIPDADDFRVKLSEDERKRLSREIEQQVEAHTKQAMVALVAKLQETVSIFTERLKEDDPTLRRSLIENIKEVVEETAAMNLVDDKRIDAFRKAADALTKGVDLEQLKTDKKARKELASKADDVLAKMAGYIGG